jgi:hypothetical protein
MVRNLDNRLCTSLLEHQAEWHPYGRDLTRYVLAYAKSLELGGVNDDVSRSLGYLSLRKSARYLPHFASSCRDRGVKENSKGNSMKVIAAFLLLVSSTTAFGQLAPVEPEDAQLKLEIFEKTCGVDPQQWNFSCRKWHEDVSAAIPTTTADGPAEVAPAPVEEAAPAPIEASPVAQPSDDDVARVYNAATATRAEVQPTQVTDAPVDPDAGLRGWPTLFAIVVGCALAICVYFAPTFVAYRRNHNDKLAILVFNIFFGWFAWIWALTGNVERNIQVNVNFNDVQGRRVHSLLIDDDASLPMPRRRGGFITGGDD